MCIRKTSMGCLFPFIFPAVAFIKQLRGISRTQICAGSLICTDRHVIWLTYWMQCIHRCNISVTVKGKMKCQLLLPAGLNQSRKDRRMAQNRLSVNVWLCIYLLKLRSYKGCWLCVAVRFLIQVTVVLVFKKWHTKLKEFIWLKCELKPRLYG